MNEASKKMVEKFLCPGCVSGSSTKCGSFRPSEGYGAGCKSHVLGTTVMGAGNMAIGLPKGFNKPGPMNAGPDTDKMRHSNTMEIRLWKRGTAPEWNNLNVAVWALVEDGHLFVRTLAPRVGRLYVDVIEGGTMAMVPHAIDVAKFYGDID